MTCATITMFCATLTLVAEPEPVARFGYLSQPAYSIDKRPRLPLTPYQPQPGDVLIYSDPDFIWATMYMIALTGAPGHSGLVVRMGDGQLGVLEAGYNDKPWTHTVPLERRLGEYKGHIWVRRRKTPLTDEQSRVLTEFSDTIEGNRYALGRLILQMTPIRTRGPLRTVFVGKSNGKRDHYTCAEATLEALVRAGAVDKETARPSATYPRDMFYDRSSNLYINRHPPLACDWEVPALWQRCP